MFFQACSLQNKVNDHPPPRIFYIPDITNSSSHSGESLRKKSMLGNIRVDVLTSIVVDCLAGKDIEDMDKYDFLLFCSLSNRSFHQRVSSPTTSLPTYEVSSPTPLNYRIQGHFCAYTHINNNNLLFLVLLSTAEPNKPLYPELNAIQLIPHSFIHCRAKRKSILDIGSQSDWHISVVELTFDVGKTTTVVGELVDGETTGIHSL